jgi:hypothetical protein
MTPSYFPCTRYAGFDFAGLARGFDLARLARGLDFAGLTRWVAGVRPAEDAGIFMKKDAFRF